LKRKNLNPQSQKKIRRAAQIFEESKISKKATDNIRSAAIKSKQKEWFERIVPQIGFLEGEKVRTG